MMKRLFSLLLVCVMLCSMLPISARAATQGSYTPYPMVEYGYSADVTVGTIRYVSQVSSDYYFYWDYWPSSNFGYYVGPQVECGTASMSMALSYVGENRTPYDILTPNNGGTAFTSWGNASYLSVSASSLSTAVDRYINGNGKYSPPVIHIPGYSAAGHYVVVAGRISSNQYWILDPWQRALTSMTVNGTSAVYVVYGSTYYDNIDQIHQWYNANASLDYSATCDSYASHCEVKTTQSTSLNSQPCYAGANDCTSLETVASGKTLTATKLFKNDDGELWYRVTTSSGKTGYLYAGHSSYVRNLTDDVSLSSGATAPNGHVSGNVFVVNGTISADYSGMTEASVYIYNGFGTSGTPVTGGSAAVSGTSYVLDNSTIDYNTSFNSLTAGKYTYAIAAKYTNYYATSATAMKSVSGTVDLMKEYFLVISAAGNQSTCSHGYATTTLNAATCTANGTQIKSCSKCGKVITETTAVLGHAYGPWTTQNATCVANGSRSRTCSRCGDVQTETLTAGGHSYTATAVAGNCQVHPHVTHTCTYCGDTYNTFDDAITSAWSTTKPSVDASLMETKTQYRYSDYETKTSYEPTLSGYTPVSSTWDASTTKTGSVQYVNSWPSGFNTSNSLYTQYNKKSAKVTAGETATTKTEVNSDAVTGYLYYHWCYGNSYYSVSSKQGSYTTFHAYYSTTNPSNYSCDTSDMSYKTANTNCCTNSEWFFVADVNSQNYTTTQKLYTHEHWTDWTSWSDTAVTASDTRKVETQNLYRYVTAELGDHNYVNGVCSVCGDTQAVAYTCQLAALEVSCDAEVLLRMKMIIDDSIVNDDRSYVTMTKDGKDTIFTAADLRAMGTDSRGRYILEQGIASGEMTYDVTVKIYNGNGQLENIYDYATGAIGTSVTRNVMDYAERIFNLGTQEQKDLIAALVTYGGYSQLHFNTDAGNPAYNALTNCGMSIPNIQSITADSFTQQISRTGNAIGITQTNTRVFLDSAIYMRAYFVLDAGKSIDDYTFTLTYSVNNNERTKTLEPGYDAVNNRYYVDIEDIAAAYLDYMYTITVTNGSGTYVVKTSAMAWAKLAMQATTDVNQINMIKAMYYYNQAANTYFGK